MNMRTSTYTVTFPDEFVLPGYPDELPAGEYEVVIEEERLQGLSFEAYRRTATYLTIHGKGEHAGRTELRPVSERDMELAITHGRNIPRDVNDSEAALSPQEDLK
ncbi:hypothetical protein OEZ60_21205 [Defluviimonas sp. WL0024]|uniref:Uncharacterized protein n=1 Tax=Albidovulum salinarum TaxID=2984153 RepID=A0ABT2XA42_9RHOB|nr:hypothetical protein [Defluviimonas sp. WL0024]MCU9850505.1 hypothetical protein [Defluviimonas sp. WL0024]